jgi:hypothetical protein
MMKAASDAAGQEAEAGMGILTVLSMTTPEAKNNLHYLGSIEKTTKSGACRIAVRLENPHGNLIQISAPGGHAA